MSQRMFDLIFSATFLIILLPIFLPIVLFLKLTGEGEVFYYQNRIGLNGNNFKIIKFATMKKNSPNILSGTITVKNDPRILPFGKWLRISKINELPQLLNIIKGDMSFVGPRPLTKKIWNYYSEETKKQIKKIRPGLTGVGSIYFRDEEKFFTKGVDPEIVYKEKISPLKSQCEIWYSRNNNILVYFILLFLTSYIVIFKNSNFPNYLFKNYIK
jgi:lipopolysaccharide/colanic/teichoic acid biosynthesis glycosyltransferase